METEKDYSLLRPFDLDATKRGELLQWFNDDDTYTLVAGPDAGGRVCVSKVGIGKLHLLVCLVEYMRVAPLCWVEGKPVYKGDVPYQNTPMMPGPRVVVGGNENGIADTHGSWNGREHLTWTPPNEKRKEKRKVKLLAHINRYGRLVWAREDLYLTNGNTRVPSEDKVVEFEDA